jgi:hypothetical protein
MWRVARGVSFRRTARSDGLPLGLDSIAMTWGLTGDNHAKRTPGFIQRLVLLSGGNLDSLTGNNNKVMMFNLKSQFAFQNEKELACMFVPMSSLPGTRGHPFFDDAEFLGLNEMPAIAVSSLRTSPLIMFCRFYVDYLCRHEFPPGN